MTTAASQLKLLPLVVDGTAPTRTSRDRLEVLTALIAAPAFDPLFAAEVIKVPRRHPVYGWGCGILDCLAPRSERHAFCAGHERELRGWRAAGNSSTAEFIASAQPLPAMLSRQDSTVCRICPDLPARAGRLGLCSRHGIRWHAYRGHQFRAHREPDFDTWVASERPFPSMGPCRVVACPEAAEHPIGMCAAHQYRYAQEGQPGQARWPDQWGRRRSDFDRPAPLTYGDKRLFIQWLRETHPSHRNNGKLSLLGLPPLVKAEIQWTMFHHTQSHNRGAAWPLTWIQRVADDCRGQHVLSLADLDLEQMSTFRQKQVAMAMLGYLRLVYFTRDDTRDAGFIETEHYGIRFASRGSFIDLTCISQRWFRDLVWDWMDARLVDGKHRSRNSFEVARRGCMELSAYLQAQAPGGGHDPTQITPAHIVDFVADQRHRAKHGLAPLAVFYRDRRKVPVVGKESLARTLNGSRQVLRAALETGRAEKIGLARAVVVALPASGVKGGRRRPFPDEVAQALADEDNLARLDQLDPGDRGLRDIWEILVATGRRSSEAREVRLECIGRLGGLPMFWHDQSKVGNYDQAIRIPERTYQRIRQRQDKTITRFLELHGRPPTNAERKTMALFPRVRTNRDFRLNVSAGWFGEAFNTWIDELDIGHWVPHQARHTLATNLLRNGADLTHVKRYLGQVSERMAEHYVHLANTDPRLEDALNAVWVSGPGSAEPGIVLSGGEPMTRQEAEAMAIDLSRRSTPAEGGICTFQPVVRGEACPWNMDCHNCDKFVLSGADLLYWRRKAEQWRTLAERAPDNATADYLHEVFEPTARAIAGLEKALAAVDLLDQALALDLRRPQDYFGRIWSLSFRASALTGQEA